MGLWATIHSCDIDLQGSGFKYSYVVVTNGEEKLAADTKNILEFAHRADRLYCHKHYKEPLSPPVARDKGAYLADAPILFFFDNHCMVARDYFKNAMQDFADHPEMDMLHSTTMFYTGEKPCYEYKFQLEINFWGSATPYPKTPNPYMIGAGGHGGFAVRRDVFYEVGGYWDGFVGYGGEEMYFDLKMWQLGKTNWIDPRVIHYHYAGDRGYPRHYTNDYYRNMMACANIIGGEKWMHTVYESFSRPAYPKPRANKSMFDLLMDAQYQSSSHAQFIASRRTRTLDELLEYFRENDIAF